MRYNIYVNESECIIYIGKKFTIDWYFDKNGKSVVYEYFIEATEDLQDKFLILAKKMGDFGKIYDINKFRHEGDGIYAFKPQPDRYLAFFVVDKKIIVTNAFYKKTDKLPQSEKDLALKYKENYLSKK